MEKNISIVFKKIDVIFLVLFLVSFFHSALEMLFYIALLYYHKFGIKGRVKILLLATTRGILSPAIASVAVGSSFKLGIILFTSFVILITARPRERKKTNNVIAAIVLFSLTTVISSFLYCSYPVTAVFKVLSFAVPFIAVILGVASTYREYAWADYFTWLYLGLFVISFTLIPFKQFRIVNSDFQGVFNHVNVLGVVAALFIVGIYSSEFFEDKKRLRAVIIVAVVFMIYLSASRTGMAIALLVCATRFIFNRKNIGDKTIKAIFILSVVMLVYILLPNDFKQHISEIVREFIWKRNTDNIWSSREKLIEVAQRKFDANCFWGSGFMVPYIAGVYDLNLNFGLQIEPGNLIWALLGDTGIIGTLLFTVLLLVIWLQGKKSNIYILIGAIGVNMGEMVFFSANNFSILIYFLIAIYLFNKKEGMQKN